MSSTPNDSILENEDSEQFVTSSGGEEEEEEEGFLETANVLPFNRDEEEEEEGEDFGEGSQNEEHLYEEGEEEEGVKTIEFLKRPPPRRNFENQGVYVRMPDDPKGIDIGRLKNLSHDKAATIAEGVIGVLEEDLHSYVEGIVELIEDDVADYMERTGTVFLGPLTKGEIERMKIRLRNGDWGSDASFNPCLSKILCGEPSRIRMTYDKGISVCPNLSLIQMDRMANKRVQVNLHRLKRTKDGKPVPKVHGFSQTLEMTFIPADIALILFRRLYPQIGNLKVQPASRQASQELVMQHASEADPDIDTRRKGETIVKILNRKQLLLRTIDNYHKEEKFWTGSKFKGQYVNKQFFKGKYDHPSGSTLESEFLDGHFHSHKHLGLISYPRGDKFEGEWEEGRYQTGTITFSDGLKYTHSNWKYCDPPDRRYEVERYYGVKPAGKTLFSDENPPPFIPPGMYDLCEGYYNPKTDNVHRYDGIIQRKVTTAEERCWIKENCRKLPDAIDQVTPKFLPERLPGSFCDQIKRIPRTIKGYH